MNRETPHRRAVAGRSDRETAGQAAGKSAVRAELLAARRAMPAAVRHSADQRVVRDVVAAIGTADTVAAFLPFGTEPGTTASPSLPDALRAAGVRVLLPVLLPDLDLDWAGYDGRLTTAARGLREPVGHRLGPTAIAEVDVVVAPAVAVDHVGIRLGRGGGSYDRALARLPAGVPVIVPLYDREWVARLSADPHDRKVTAVVTPGRGLVRLPA